MKDIRDPFRVRDLSKSPAESSRCALASKIQASRQLFQSSLEMFACNSLGGYGTIGGRGAFRREFIFKHDA